jgi:general stress protein 26
MDIKKIKKPKDDKLHLKELHPMLMKYFTNTLFIAPTGVGKTNLIINLLDRPRFYKGKFDKVVLFSNTYHNDNIWKSCKSIDEENVYLDYDDGILQDIVDQQTEAKKQEEPINTLIIFDDIIQQINKTSSLINSLVMRNRHYYLTIWITTQKYSRVSLSIRNNISYYVLFGIKNKKEKLFITDELSDNISEDDFNKMWNYALDGKNYNFMVISAKDKPNQMYRKQFKSYIMVEDMKPEDKSSMINSIIFPKDSWNVGSGRKWLKEHKYPSTGKVELEHRPNFITFRLNSPEHMKKLGYVKYITKKLPNGVEIILAYKE